MRKIQAARAGRRSASGPGTPRRSPWMGRISAAPPSRPKTAAACWSRPWSMAAAWCWDRTRLTARPTRSRRCASWQTHSTSPAAPSPSTRCTPSTPRRGTCSRTVAPTTWSPPSRTTSRRC